MKKPPAAKLPATSGKKRANSTSFKSGDNWHGNPNGRPKGSRHTLQEKFLKDFIQLWDMHGYNALERVAKSSPVDFIRAAVAILPKQLEVDEEHHIYVISDRPLSVDDWAKKYAGIEATVEKPNVEEQRKIYAAKPSSEPLQ